MRYKELILKIQIIKKDAQTKIYKLKKTYKDAQNKKFFDRL